MQIAAITKQGLITIAILVTALWGCFIAERLTVQHADREMGRVLQQIHHVKARATMALASS